MSNALKKITTRAKQLKKTHPNAKWTSLIKQAGKEYRSGKIGAKKKKSSDRQTGSSSKYYDMQRTARAPGPRKPRGGKKVTYYERRKNRSDKPGSLTGGLKHQAEQKFANACLRYEKATTIKATKAAQKDKNKWRKVMRSI